MGIYACGGYGSRSPEEAVMGMRPWGYMHAGAIEVGVWRKAVMGMRPWGYMQEEVRRRRRRRRRGEERRGGEEVGFSFEI